MPRARVIAVGAVNRDLVVQVDRIPAVGETVFGGELQSVWGGKAANVAAAAARLGAPTELVAALGSDALGSEASAELRAAGVGTAGVTVVAGHPTGTALIVVDSAGHNAIVVTAGAKDALSPDEVSQRMAAMHLSAADCVVLSAEVPDDVLVAAAASARAAGSRILLNLSPSRALHDDLARPDTVVVVNGTEARALAAATGVPVAAAETFHRRTGQSILVTLGERGAAWFDRGKLMRADSPVVTAVDTTGAGDAFLGALAATMAAGGTAEEALRRACAAGAYACTGPGARHHADAAALAGLLTGDAR